MFGTIRHEWVLAITGILVFCAALNAEIVVTGRVIDENNAGVALAAVRFFETGGPSKLEWQATSGPAGDFTVRLPKAGAYLVTASHDGFFPLHAQSLDLGPNPRAVHLVLNHLAEVLESVEVRSNDPRAVDLAQTQAQKTLTNLDIANAPFQGRDLGSVMRLMPGVMRDPFGGVHFSGSAVNQVLYTLDGFNLTDPVSGTLDTRLNIDSIRSLQYASGRYSPEFGKGSAGVVAIETKMGSDVFRYNLTNFVPGVDTTSGPHIGTWSPRIEFSGPIVKRRIWFSESASAAYSQFVVEDVPGNNRTTTVKMDHLLRTQINLSPRNYLFASFLVNSANAPRSGLSALDPISTTVDRRARTWFFSVKHEHDLARGAVLELGYAESRTFQRQIPQGCGLYLITPFGRSGNFFLDSNASSNRRQFLVNLSPRSFHFAGSHQWKLGIDLDRVDYHVINRRTGYEQFGLNGARLNLITFGGSGIFSRPNTEISSYLVDSWRVRESLSLELGIRQDWDELLRNVVLSPRISVSASPFGWRSTKVTAGYAVTRDATSLDLFSRPLDQYSITENFNPDGSQAAPPAATWFRISHGHLRTPLYRNWTAGLEHRLTNGIGINASFVRKRGHDGLTYLAVPFATSASAMAVFDLANYRRDVYDSAEITLRQNFRKEYGWTASYTRSRALSNSVISLSVDQPLWVTNNIGPMPWDSPNQMLAWGHFPTPWPNWSLAGLMEVRDGFPYSVVTEYGATVGEVNAYRFPMYFDLDFYVERKLKLGRRFVALRAGFTNITNHRNPTVVNSVLGSPDFLHYYGSLGRHVVFRLRWLGTGE